MDTGSRVSVASGRLRRMRRMLLPGTHLLRRGDGQLQAGLDPARAVLLPVHGTVDATVADRDPALATALGSRGLLVDDAPVRAVLPGAGAVSAGPGPGGPVRGPWPRHALAALARLAGPATGEAARRREQAALSTVGFGGALGATIEAEVRELAARAALPLAGSAGRGRPRRTGTLGVAAGVGEPDRELLDPWMQAGTPHLLLRLAEGRVVLGPFVDPGRTACLRCLDAHRTDEDPDWPLLVRQYAARTAGDRADGVPEPVDPMLAAVAVGWALRDVATYVEGGSPTTWSATVHLSGRLEELQTQAWLRHPECGCSWQSGPC